MDEHMNTTIAALATPSGKGGIAVIRISGPRAEEVLRTVFTPKGQQHLWDSHYMMYGFVHDGGEAIDECMAVLMRAPRSYTMEDVAELQVHGGEFVAQRVLKLLYSLGVEPAAAGEFTRRAFLNGRIDLSQAEAVMRQISAQGEQASRAAMRQLEGGAFTFVRGISERVTELLSYVEAVLDFPEEVEESETREALSKKARAIAEELEKNCDARSARFLDTGLEVTIYGLPNVGKSSLFNALMMEDRAIVTDIPGTTRDVLRGSILLDGLRINLSDTAGIHEQSDVVETIGVERAVNAMRQADLLLVVIDGSAPLTREAHALLNQTEGKKRILLQSKSDLGRVALNEGAISFSAHTNEGLDEIKKAIVEKADIQTDHQLTLERHILLGSKAAQALYTAANAVEQGVDIDLCAVHLHEALGCLGQITGENVVEGLLDAVFASFCVGK